MRRVVIIAILLLMPLAGARSARAYTIGGTRWPGSPAHITYYETTPASYRWSIAQAAAAWNTSGVRVRLVRVTSRSHAQVVISRSGDVPQGGGYATIGYAQNAYIHLNMGAVDKWSFTGVVAHEMGHILGLNHAVHVCAVMNAVVYVSCNPLWPPNAWQWRCRVLQKDDLAGATHLYGGTPKLRHHMFCDKAPKLPAVSSMVVSEESSSPLRISKVTIKLPRRRVDIVEVDRKAGSCPTAPSDLNAHFVGQVKGKPGTTHSFFDDTPTSLPAGTYCYRAWTFDEWHRAGGSLSTELDYTGPPPVPTADVTAVSQNTLIHPADGEEAVYVDVTVNTPTLSWVDGADVVMKQGGCPVSPTDGSTPLGSVLPGAGKHVLFGAYVPDPGSWCVAAFSFDSSHRYAVAGATTSFVYTPPAAPAPTGGSASLVDSDVQVSWTWPVPAPSYASIARFDGACPATITRADIDNAYYGGAVDGAGAPTWIDNGPLPGTYCYALYDIDTWGYFSSVLKIQFTVP